MPVNFKELFTATFWFLAVEHSLPICYHVNNKSSEISNHISFLSQVSLLLIIKLHHYMITFFNWCIIYDILKIDPCYYESRYSNNGISVLLIHVCSATCWLKIFLSMLYELTSPGHSVLIQISVPWVSLFISDISHHKYCTMRCVTYCFM